jgi:ribosomal protein L37AE/L43A
MLSINQGLIKYKLKGGVEMDKIKLRCPSCGKGYKLFTNKEGITSCSYCGYEGKKEEFIVKEQ